MIQPSLSEIQYGTYTPVLTNVLNVASSIPYVAQYIKVGNVVTVSGNAVVDTTAAGDTLLGISLPLVSNLSLFYQCAGTSVSQDTGAKEVGVIYGDVANDRAVLRYEAVSTSARNMFFHFTYQIV